MISGTLFTVVAILIFAILLGYNYRNIKRPLLVALIFGLCVLSLAVGRLLQFAWLSMLNLFVLLLLSLTVLCLFDNGILGRRDKSGYWKIEKFRVEHPRLFDAILYGVICSGFILALNYSVMKHTITLNPLEMSQTSPERRSTHQMLISESMAPSVNNLWHTVLIWSALTAIVVFISSVFAKDKTAVGLGTSSILALYVLLAPLPFTLVQKLYVASACAICAYISSKLCFFTISNRIYSLFDPEEKNGRE